MAKSPSDQIRTNQASGEDLRSEARAAYKAGDVATALDRYHAHFDNLKAPLSADHEADQRTDYGGMLLKAARPAEAVVQFRAAATLRPDDLAIRDKLGKSLIRAERPGEAVDQFALIVERTPQDANALVSLAEALRRVGRNDEARDRLLQSLAIAPQNPEARLSLMALSHGRISTHSGTIGSDGAVGDSAYTEPPFNAPALLVAFGIILAIAGVWIRAQFP